MLNLEILEIVEDVDPQTRVTRFRARVRELQPRTHLVNLKNLSTDQLNLIQKNVGAVASLPARELLMDGRFMLTIPVTDEEIFILKPALSIPVSKTVDFHPVDKKTG